MTIEQPKLPSVCDFLTPVDPSVPPNSHVFSGSVSMQDICSRARCEICILWELPEQDGGNHACCCWNTQLTRQAFFFSFFFSATTLLKGKHDLAGVSHGWNIFASTLERDVNSPCVLRGPSRPTYHKPPQPESPALYISRPQADCEVFRFSEELNEDRCSFSVVVFHISLRQSVSRFRTSSGKLFSFFPVYLPASLLCQLLKGPQTSFNKKTLFCQPQTVATA